MDVDDAAKLTEERDELLAGIDLINGMAYEWICIKWFMSIKRKNADVIRRQTVAANRRRIAELDELLTPSH